jgi:predicted dipeptidase
MITTQKIADQYKDWLNDTTGLLAIASFRQDGLANNEAPYGPGPKQALDYMMALAKRDGFANIGTLGNRVGYINLGPAEDQAPIGVIVHVDVVPVNDIESWHTAPFEPTVSGSHLIARGADDMKSETMMTYYAFKIIKEMNLPLKHQIRLIIGTDEESEWADMHQYFDEMGPITTGFSPDGADTLAYGEKGISQLDLYSQATNSPTGAKLLNFHSGVATNVLPGKASAEIKGVTAEDITKKFTAYLSANPEVTGETIDGKITIFGKATHAARPETGVNAATHLANFLNEFTFGGTAKDFLNFVGNKLHQDPYGERSTYGGAEPKLGKTTQNIGITDFEDGSEIHINLNYRYSLAFNEQDVISRLKVAEPWLTDIVRDPAGLIPHYVDPESKIVNLLRDSYKEVTGREVTMGVNGGASFGRLMSNGVGFGARITEAPSTAHAANEYFDLEAYTPSMSLLVNEIYNLSNNLD